MPEISVRAIVLRRKDSGESDRRLTILTPELGKVDVVAKGARKSASRLSGSSEPLSMAVLSLASGKQAAFITQAQPLAAFRGLRGDFERLSMGLALAELYAAITPYEQPDEDAFNLLALSLEWLEKTQVPLRALVWAEVRLLELSGFMPQLDACVATGRSVAEAVACVSPQGGGYVSAEAAHGFDDLYRVRAEALIGLARIGSLQEPPPNLKHAEECLLALRPIWRYVADTALPANEAVFEEARSRLSSPGAINS